MQRKESNKDMNGRIVLLYENRTLQKSYWKIKKVKMEIGNENPKQTFVLECGMNKQII